MMQLDVRTLPKALLYWPVLKLINPSDMQVTISVVNWLLGLHHKGLPVENLKMKDESQWEQFYCALEASLGLSPADTMAMVKLMIKMLECRDNQKGFLETKGLMRVMAFATKDTRPDISDYQKKLFQYVIDSVDENDESQSGINPLTHHVIM